MTIPSAEVFANTEGGAGASDPLERSALKEWAVLVDAMARGEFCAMIRKGGIREQRAGFSVRHDRFLMYPTYFHEKVDELVPALKHRLPSVHERRPTEGRVAIQHCAVVRATWKVAELEALRELEGEHGLEWKAVESRFHYKNNPGVHVVAVELMALPHTANIPETRRYQGCVSWVELDNSVDLSGSVWVRPRSEVAARVKKLHDILGNTIDEELL